MNKLKKIVVASIKTRNIVKRHNKEHQIAGFYEHCKNIQKIINEDRELKGEFTIKDIGHFFTGYHILSKSIFKMNKTEFEKSIKEYFYVSPKTTNYYFRVDSSYQVINNQKVGNGKILKFSSMPKKIKERIESNYQFENNMGHFANQSPDKYKELRSNDYYMKIEIKSRGQDSSTQKALNYFQENTSIFEFFTLTNFRDELETSAVYITTDEKNNPIGHYFGGVTEKTFHSKSFLVEYIQKINQILEKEEKHRNVIEKNILLAIKVVGLNDSNPNVNVRLFFCMVAIEFLLIGNNERGIVHRLIERMAFLLGGDEDWIHHYKTIIKKSKDSRKITKKYISRHLKDSRIELANTTWDLYNKRSNIAHLTSNITENDYYLSKLLLLKTTIQLFRLLGNGIKHIDNNNYPETESLKYFINQLKYK